MDSKLLHPADGTWEVGSVEGVRDVRTAILDAVVDEVASRGWEAAGVAGICRRAGVEAAVFASEFAGKEDCFLAAGARFVEALIRAVKTAVRVTDDWETGTRAGLGAFLTYLAEHPVAARAFLVEGLAAGREALAMRDLAMRTFCRFVDDLQQHAHEVLDPSNLVSEAGVGGIYGIVTARIRSGETESLPELLSSLAYFLLAPVVGRPRAQLELSGVAV